MTSDSGCIKTTGKCFESSKYGQSTGYSTEEDCSVTAKWSGALRVVEFDTASTSSSSRRWKDSLSLALGSKTFAPPTISRY